MRLILRSLICICLLFSVANAAKEKTPKKPIKPLPEMCMGNKKAPVIVIAYSSLTCVHCAQFHTEVLPLIEKNYIEPGKIRFVFRDFPGDKISVIAHELAWSRGEMKYFDLLKLFYSTQDKWLNAQDPVKALKEIALKNGITEKQYDACIKNAELLDKIIQVRLEGQKKYNITATPTIIINAKIHPRFLSYNEFQEIVDPMLALCNKKDKKKKG